MQQSSNRPPKSSPAPAWGSPTPGAWGSPAPGSWGSPALRQSTPLLSPTPRQSTPLPSPTPRQSTPFPSPATGWQGNQQSPSQQQRHWGPPQGGWGGSPRGGGFTPRGRGSQGGGRGHSPSPYSRPSWDRSQSSTPRHGSPGFDSSACLGSSDSWNSSTMSSSSSSSSFSSPWRGRGSLSHNRSFPGASGAGQPSFQPQAAPFLTPQPFPRQRRDDGGDSRGEHHWSSRGQGSPGDYIDERSLQAMTSDPWAGLPPVELPASPQTSNRRPHSRFLATSQS